MRLFVLGLALAGCNRLLGIEQTQFVDGGLFTAPDAPDRDRDTIADELDNCPDDSNQSQSDVDNDGKGDACDNCPIINNPLQHEMGDQDGIGDACDPNPRSNGDCLLLVDSLTDVGAFATHWNIVPPQYANTVTVAAGNVKIDGSARVGVYSKDFDAMKIDTVQLLGHKPNINGEGGIAIDTSEDTKLGYRCLVAQDITAGPALWAQIDTTTVVINSLSSDPIDPDLVLRLATPITGSQGTTLQCRVDFGVAVASARAYTNLNAQGGGYSGAFASGAPLTMNAIAFYHREDPCPAPVRR